ncbi:reverse transcriptase-like protein [Elysia marginata]|uniref:Reverse transcriptase-like protein n=1 Tax=Elysia marginata TaxID=1093978 RepID=A0AAV4ICW4_9GAST|nr:reverse transcriptase-like protein [Elysia marginata]
MSINPFDFKNKLSSILSKDPPRNIDSLNSALSKLLEDAAPMRRRTVKPRPPAPWLTPQVKAAKQERRKAERQWKKSGLTVHRDIYRLKHQFVCNLIKDLKRKYVNDKIVESRSSKEIFNICNDLLGKNKPKSLPNNFPPDKIPDVLNDFFVEKVDKIRQELDAKKSEPFYHEFKGDVLKYYFEPVTEQVVRNIILDSSKTSCDLDTLPSNLFIECLDLLLPYITNCINDSLESGSVPCCFKEAIVRPLLKKNDLDENLLKNYRPVSNLPFLSKVLEKVVLIQIESHLNKNRLKEIYQSAYKKKHSTETALLKVHSDLLEATDSGQVSILALLDLSAAFNTLDHQILLRRLEVSFGFKNNALKWVASYLENRTQTVSAGGYHSKKSFLRYGVPQGSVLGPILFSLYSQPISNVLSKHGFRYHLYADDTQ